MILFHNCSMKKDEDERNLIVLYTFYNFCPRIHSNVILRFVTQVLQNPSLLFQPSISFAQWLNQTKPVLYTPYKYLHPS